LHLDGLIGVVVVLVLAVVTLVSIIFYLKRSRDTPSDKHEVYEEPMYTQPANSATPLNNTNIYELVGVDNLPLTKVA